MQPYFFPYIGYFQLIATTDAFVIYDNIKYTKKGWINRNRILLNEKEFMFSISLVKDSDYLNVCDRCISPEYQRGKLLRQLELAYKFAPQFDIIFPKIVEIINYNSNNLFDYIHNSVVQLCQIMDIKTELYISSALDINHNLKKQEKVLAICKTLQANEYINPIGGLELYSREQFQASGIVLKFIKTEPIEYPQFGNLFIPNLSIIDILMFNHLNQVKQWLQYKYQLL